MKWIMTSWAIVYVLVLHADADNQCEEWYFFMNSCACIEKITHASATSWASIFVWGQALSKLLYKPRINSDFEPQQTEMQFACLHYYCSGPKRTPLRNK